MFKVHRQKVVEQLRKVGGHGLAYLKGGSLTIRKWTDVEEPFRQESNFYYLTGVNEPDHHLVIDIESETSTLFIPDYSPDHSLWCGEPLGIQESLVKYGIEQVKRTRELESVLKSSESVHAIEEAENFNTTILRDCITQARMYKNASEIELMRRACKISGEAHISLMKTALKVKGEQQLHAKFIYECFSHGAPLQAYTPIVACGKAAATLHYISNDKPLVPNSLVLVDAGCEYKCYASDITRTWPLSGKFQGPIKTVYEIVLQAQKKVLESMKPGIEWEEMHRLATLVIAQGLIKAGIITSSLEDALKNHIPALFFPHGLGHLLGIDVHDVGGYPKGVERIQEPGIKYLRARRKMEPGMVFTVEPGVYFVDAILDPAIADPNIANHLDLSVLALYRNIGGVRIEDDVLITETGIDNLTGWVPKEISDIEKIINGDLC